MTNLPDDVSPLDTDGPREGPSRADHQEERVRREAERIHKKRADDPNPSTAQAAPDHDREGVTDRGPVGSGSESAGGDVPGDCSRRRLLERYDLEFPEREDQESPLSDGGGDSESAWVPSTVDEAITTMELTARMLVVRVVQFIRIAEGRRNVSFAEINGTAMRLVLLASESLQQFEEERGGANGGT